MQVYVGGRASGKTHHLINLSHDTGIPIVVRSARMSDEIRWQSVKMGKVIPKPICYRDREAMAYASQLGYVLVDEAGAILNDVMGARVVAAAIDGEALRLANPALGNLESMGLLELLRAWREGKKGKRNG